MTTGSSADIVSRVKQLIPGRWFAFVAPYRDAVLGGLADSAAWNYGLIGYARAQTRLSTAYGIWLDIFAFDFLGPFMVRNGLNDDVFRGAIRATILQERVTRAGMINAVTMLTGNAPRIFEPWNTFDTGCYSSARVVIGTTTNLLTFSQQFDQTSAWAEVNILAFGSGSVANATAAPDGTITADKIVEDSTTNVHRIQQNITVTLGTSYTVSVYAKAAGRAFLRIEFFRGLTAATAHFDLTTGAIGTVSNTTGTSAVNVGNGWWRCSVSFVTDGTAATSYFYGIPTFASPNTWAGDGVSGIFVWGAQLEVGNAPTTYIPTTNAAATRNITSTPIVGGQFGYGVGQGGYGNMNLPAQTFMQINLGSGAGIPNVDGYGGVQAGYGAGSIEYAGPSIALTGITNQVILNTINKTKPTGTTMWVVFMVSPPPPLLTSETGVLLTDENSPELLAR